MRILMAHNWYFTRGGADRVFFETIKLLEKHGHTVIPFSMKDERNTPTRYDYNFVDKIDYSRINTTFGNLKTSLSMIYSLEARKKIEELIVKTKPDVAHLHNIYGRITPAIVYSLRKHRIPIVMTLHDYKAICPSYQMTYNGKPCERCKGNRFYNAVFLKCHKNSFMASLVYCIETYVHYSLKAFREIIDYFITPSLFLRQKMVEFGIAERKLEYIPNFVDISSYPPSLKNRGYFVYCGKLLRVKGVFTLLKAIKGMNTSSFLYLAGDGDSRNHMEEFAVENKIKNVRFLGHLTEVEISKVLSEANFVVLPSECYENAPLVVLEAFAYGKPVIGSRIGGIPELIDDGVDGLLHEPGDVQDLREKLCRMLGKSENELMRMGAHGRERVCMSFNAELHYTRLCATYKKAIAKR